MKRTLVLSTALTVLVLALPSIPALAGATRVPEDPNIVDPAGDANGLGMVDVSGPVQIDQADILAAWFTNDRKTITANWHVSAAPTIGAGIQLTLTGLIDRSGPLPQDVGRFLFRPRCLFFSAVWRLQDAGPYKPYTGFIDGCFPEGEDSGWFIGKPDVIELADGTAIVRHTVDRRSSPNLRTGVTIDGPRANSYYAHWVAGHAARPGQHRYDGAQTGRDYTIRP